MSQKIQVLNIDGKKLKEISLPEFFTKPIREDIIFKVLETFKTKHPYSPSPVAGKQHSASGKIRHRRHVWKTHYGRGMSRIPRKTMTKRGSQFNWIGAEISSTRGGRRAHPPKTLGMINTKKINKKELKIAFVSALAATASSAKVAEKYKTLRNKKVENFPLIVEGKITKLKTKELIKSIKEILGKEIFEVAQRKKSIRTGKGKMRGRKYKKTAGILIVIGKNENIKTKNFNVVKANSLGILDLAKGSPGRLVIYTEQAIKEIQERLEGDQGK